ncbi:alpha/beta hydrolase [Sphingomonas sp. A2-49]|uniref:alpha/beta hydrolase n=1 Tax=Sphingomonas sp. A2-49 TaxID=1391375 RepID=UPI0021CEC73C|nr:alpha/beta hydrolase [Sphingomonas sp. A2-49]MCU6455514.1 alpha/beta hydrolase [Sphingomonas sp. A2-49]
MTIPLTWPDLTARPRPRPDATIAYGPDAMQRIDLWRPAGTGPHRVVVMVHGGCWQTGIADRRLMDWVAADLRDHGIAVWNIDYRGADRDGGGYPGTFRDVAAAADRLRAEAAAHALDLTRIVAVGHSAGGHLALWLAARHRIAPGSPVHDAQPLEIGHVVSLGGLPDLEAVAASPDNGCGTAVIAQLVGDRPEPFADTSVPRLLPIGVAQTLVNGREDRIVPYRFATDYRDRAAAAGDRVMLRTVADTGHVELIAPGTPAWTLARDQIVAAFRRETP